jgi:DNA replication protein DnaC
MIGQPSIADAILDRLIHNAHRIALEGESMRKTRAPSLLTQGVKAEIIAA